MVILLSLPQGLAGANRHTLRGRVCKAIESLIKSEIPRGEAPEGYEPSTADSRPDRAPREDRKGRDRGGRSRERERPVKAHEEVAPMEPLAVAPKAEPAVEAAQPEERRDERREPRADRGGDRRREERGEGRGERRDDRREPREDRRDDRREPREDRRDYRRDRDLGPSVIGMGDHVPDFILRSFALKAAPTEEVEEPVPATGTEG